MDPSKELKTVYVYPVKVKNLQSRKLDLIDAVSNLRHMSLHMYEAELNAVRHNYILQDF